MTNGRDAGTRRNSVISLLPLGVSASLRFVLSISLLVAACSIPNLEEPDCDQARDIVREFYSRHFGEEAAVTQDNFGWRSGYLTPRLNDDLQTAQWAADPFTQTEDRPKAFRAGECRVVEPGRRVQFQLLLFWKTDSTSEQQAIAVEAEKLNGKWLIDHVGR
ncbi:MAG TPA: hypothetical protein VNA22_00040 [Pyrinomonadaceae bacterium]|nr:hypothetical protein [Pyrinomonadaceae bacterium]